MFLTFAMISFVAGLGLWLHGRAIRRDGRDGSNLPAAKVGREAPRVEMRSEGSFWVFAGKLFMFGAAGFFTMHVATTLFLD